MLSTQTHHMRYQKESTEKTSLAEKDSLPNSLTREHRETKREREHTKAHVHTYTHTHLLESRIRWSTAIAGKEEFNVSTADTLAIFSHGQLRFVKGVKVRFGLATVQPILLHNDFAECRLQRCKELHDVHFVGRVRQTAHVNAALFLDTTVAIVHRAAIVALEIVVHLAAIVS